MTRPEIVEAAARALQDEAKRGGYVVQQEKSDAEAAAVLAVVEPMIRQDERERALALIASAGSFSATSFRFDGTSPQDRFLTDCISRSALESEINQLAGKAET